MEVVVTKKGSRVKEIWPLEVKERKNKTEVPLWEIQIVACEATDLPNSGCDIS